MTLIFSIFFVIINGLIYKLLYNAKSFKRVIMMIPAFFVFMIIIIKIYNKFRVYYMPDGIAIFILLGFSFGIIMLYLFKKTINLKVNVAESLNINDMLPSNIFLKVITGMVTFLQLVLILSKTIYIFKD